MSQLAPRHGQSATDTPGSSSNAAANAASSLNASKNSLSPQNFDDSPTTGRVPYQYASTSPLPLSAGLGSR